MGREVLKVKPKITELPAASPAVLARSFCDATSPTKAHPREPIKASLLALLVINRNTTILDIRATLKNDQTHAVKIRKFISGVVCGTRPRMPTISMWCTL